MHLHRGELDGDTLFALKLHGIKKLRLHLSLLHRVSDFHHAISKRGLAVVDVSNNTEITNVV